MKTSSSSFRPLTLAVVAVMLGAFAAPVFAQQPTAGQEAESMRAQRAKRLKELGKDTETKQAKATEEAALYPNASRQSPEAKVKGKGKLVKLTVKVSTAAGISPTGKVVVKLQGKTKKTIKAKVNAKGVAKIKVKNVKRGKYKAKVSYAGNANVSAAKVTKKFKV